MLIIAYAYHFYKINFTDCFHKHVSTCIEWVTINTFLTLHVSKFSWFTKRSVYLCRNRTQCRWENSVKPEEWFLCLEKLIVYARVSILCMYVCIIHLPNNWWHGPLKSRKIYLWKNKAWSWYDLYLWAVKCSY